MDKRPHNAHANNILNIQYSVFLGVILSFSFYVKTTNVPTVCPVIDLKARPEAILFAIYFLLDWFTANIIQQRDLPTPAYLLGRVAWVAVLGATVISLNGSGSWKFYLLSTYVIVSGLYDFVFMWNLFARNASAETVRSLLLAGIRFMVGATFLLPVLMALLGRTDVIEMWDNSSSPCDVIFWMSLVYVVLKAGRFAYLVKVKVE